jgi:hypothetical protein
MRFLTTGTLLYPNAVSPRQVPGLHFADRAFSITSLRHTAA